jgi:hypothetical protein
MQQALTPGSKHGNSAVGEESDAEKSKDLPAKSNAKDICSAIWRRVQVPAIIVYLILTTLFTSSEF